MAMDYTGLVEKWEKSFRDAIYHETRLHVHNMLYDGDRFRLSEKEILRWAARRARQELDIANLCQKIAQSEVIDEELRSYVLEQQQQEIEHNRMLRELIEKYGDNETIEYLHKITSPSDASKEWEEFITARMNEDPLVALISLEYGHEVYSDVGFEEMELLPYKPIVEVLQRIAKDERTHANLGKIVLLKYLQKESNPAKAEMILRKFMDEEFRMVWPLKVWN